MPQNLRSPSPEPQESVKRPRHDPPSPPSRSRLLQKAKGVLLEAKEIYAEVERLGQNPPAQDVEKVYAPIFKKLTQALVDTDKIPLPPAADYDTYFLNAMAPNTYGYLREKAIAKLTDYIINEDKKRLHHRVEFEHKLSPSLLGPVETAWKTKYIGNSHKLLKKAMKDMHSRKSKNPYGNFCAIIQGSGTGKSRLVDKLAESVFTIPMILRPREDLTGFPKGDKVGNRQLLEYFCQDFRNSGSAVLIPRVYLNFLLGTIAFVDRWLDDQMNSRHRTKIIARQWKDYLGAPLSPNRLELYDAAINHPLQDFEDIVTDEPISEDSLRRRVKKYIDSVSTKLETMGGQTTSLILFYFDEAHHLTKAMVTDGIPMRTAYQCLCKAFTFMTGTSVFALFLSTYSRLSEFAPSARNFWSSRPEFNQRESDDNMNAPFVELPFDIWKKPTLAVEGTHTRQEICSLAFKARFGRPLFWALIEEEADENKVLEHAISKLQLRHEDLTFREHYNYPTLELIPPLAIRVDLTFESNRDEAVLLEGLLVASSMRTVYSVPQHRQYLRGGYPSEPFLAEVAARTISKYCHIKALGNDGSMRWKQEAANKVIATYKKEIPLAVSKWLSRGLIDKGTRGELVARMLLTLAYDCAILKNPALCKGLGDSVSFSHMVPVVDFLRALISKKKIENVLTMRPIDDPSGLTLREAFRHAFVHFSQFVKAGDLSAVTDDAALSFILRAAAVQGYHQMPGADFFVPIWIPRHGHDCPDRWAMSGIFGEVKDRVKAERIFIDVQKTFQFFTPSKHKVDNERPYITIAMELGTTATEAPEPEVKSVSTVKNKGKGKGKNKGKAKAKNETQGKAKNKGKGKAKEMQTTNPETSPGKPSCDEVKINSRQRDYFERNAKARSTHPCYDITIQGCSEQVYEVIDDSTLYSSLLAREDLLAEHPRPDKEYHDAILQMKPYWLAESYGWISMRNGSRLGAPVVPYGDEVDGQEIDSSEDNESDIMDSDAQ